MTVHILGINGSNRAGSTADRALGFALRLAGDGGATTGVFDIGSLPLLDMRPDSEYPAAVAEWRAACTAADAIIIASPSFHGAIPGSLKNALDFIDHEHVAQKPYAVLGVAGGDAEPAVTDVTRVMRHIGCLAAVPDVVVSRSRELWGSGEEPVSEEVRAVLSRAVSGLLAVATLRASGAFAAS